MGFNIFLALSSPCPILVDTMAGSSIMVISTTLYMLFTTLLKEIISMHPTGKFPMNLPRENMFLKSMGTPGSGGYLIKLLGNRPFPTFPFR